MSSSSSSLRKPTIVMIGLVTLLLSLTLTPKAFSANNPLLIKNVATAPFSASFASQPSTVVPGTCAHWVVDVTTLRDVVAPRIEISGWQWLQPCRGTTSLRLDYHNVAGCACRVLSGNGNPYWKFPAQLVKDGVVPKGTHYAFILNAYIPYAGGSYLQSFSFYETGKNGWSQISSAPAYSYIGSPDRGTGGRMK